MYLSCATGWCEGEWVCMSSVPAAPTQVAPACGPSCPWHMQEGEGGRCSESQVEGTGWLSVSPVPAENEGVGGVGVETGGGGVQWRPVTQVGPGATQAVAAQEWKYRRCMHLFHTLVVMEWHVNAYYMVMTNISK